MANKYLNSNGLSYFWGKIKALTENKADKEQLNALTERVETLETTLAALNTGFVATEADMNAPNT